MYVCMYVIHYKAQTAEDRSSILAVSFYIFSAIYDANTTLETVF